VAKNIVKRTDKTNVYKARKEGQSRAVGLRGALSQAALSSGGGGGRDKPMGHYGSSYGERSLDKYSMKDREPVKFVSDRTDKDTGDASCYHHEDPGAKSSNAPVPEKTEACEGQFAQTAAQKRLQEARDRNDRARQGADAAKRAKMAARRG